MSDWVTLKNSLGLTLRTIDAWPGELTRVKKNSPFSAPTRDTLAMLKRELKNLNAKNIVLQIAVRPQDLRLDGLPRADARASHPGIILTFDSKHGPLRLSFDAFRYWEHNLRAIALHLEHLRMAGLYGVGRAGEQYRGWTALPAPPADDITSVEDAAKWMAKWLADLSGADILKRVDEIEKMYRAVARLCHPDTQDGSHEDFVKLGKATDILKAYKENR